MSVRAGDVRPPPDPAVPDESSGPPPRLRGRQWRIPILLTVLAVLLIAALNWPDRGPSGARVASQQPRPAGTWLSGAAGVGVTSGAFASWRGRPVDITGTWVDNNSDQTGLWPLRPGGPLASWQGSLDIAIGAISQDETWKEAASGEFDDRWRRSLSNLRDLWGARPGTVYIRFAHEMNGDWYPWAVNAGNYHDFITAWRRFRLLQKEIFPAARLVFCVNRVSVGNGMDWRAAFPGRRYVDVVGVDYYNQNPYIGSAQDWNTSLDQTDRYGGPEGLLQYLDFARQVGLPLAVPEWSGNAAEGDSPAFIRGMYEFFRDHAGHGPGQILYEILFNVDRDGGQWLLYGDGVRMPASAEEYRRLW